MYIYVYGLNGLFNTFFNCELKINMLHLVFEAYNPCNFEWVYIGMGIHRKFV